MHGGWRVPGRCARDVLIVVAAERIDGDTLGLSSYWRSVYAGRAWRAGGFRRVVVAGAGVAPLIRDFLVGHGVPADAITLEEASTSTRENALNVARLLSGTPGTKVLLTSDYHMFRAGRPSGKPASMCGPSPSRTR